MTKYFFDTEFIEDGTTIDLISIGMVSEDGRELHLCSNEADLEKADEWVQENVLPHLPTNPKLWKTRDEIKEALLEFTDQKYGEPQFWANHADYDWVALCQLFGKMIDLPDHYPKYCMDIKQVEVELGNPKLPEQEGTEHDALEDAKYNLQVYNFLKKPKGLKISKRML